MNVPTLLLIVAGGLTAFGWWGLHTDAGRQRFDEMAGMIPFGAYWAGIVLGAVALIWLAVAATKDGPE